MQILLYHRKATVAALSVLISGNWSLHSLAENCPPVPQVGKVVFHPHRVSDLFPSIHEVCGLRIYIHIAISLSITFMISWYLKENRSIHLLHGAWVRVRLPLALLCTSLCLDPETSSVSSSSKSWWCNSTANFLVLIGPTHPRGWRSPVNQVKRPVLVNI